jgi:acyl-CoA thioester hydrolase
MDLKLDDFPARNFDKLRYGDTDKQGHINNAVFATLFETGRVGVIHEAEPPLLRAGFSFVIARIAIDYRSELFWPGRVEIGTAVKAVGTSSVTFSQALFQDGRVAAVAESVVVQVDVATRRPAPLEPAVRARLEGLRVG